MKMGIKKVSPTDTITKENIDATIISQNEAKKHIVYFDTRSYKEQPTGGEMGRVTNRFKYGVTPQHVTLKDILRKASNGYSFLPYNYETINNQIVFLGSSIAFVDVDDDKSIFDIQNVLEALGKNIGGLFYTFSHGIKGNRYRVAFELDRTVTNEREYKSILKYFAGFLRSKGIPADGQPTIQPIRGGLKGYEFVEGHMPFSVDKLLEKIKPLEEAEQREYIERMKKNAKYNAMFDDIPYSVLEEMADCIGIIPDGVGIGRESGWILAAYSLKSYANSGAITQEEGLDLLCRISSNHEQAAHQWRSMKPRKANIGSFITIAKNNGWKGAIKVKTPTSYKYEYIKIDRYISTELALSLLEEGGRILIDSSTSSGKTTALLKAFEVLEVTDLSTINIFAVPNIVLAQQLERKHGYMRIQGSQYDERGKINRYIQDGNKNFVATYDKVPKLIEHISTEHQDFKFNLVIDEYHKTITENAKTFRYNATSNLVRIGELENCHAYIALSGTTEDIDKNDFDRVLKLDNGKPSSPCREFKVLTVPKKDKLLAQLTSFIQKRANEGNRLLVFIQNIEELLFIKEAIRKNVKVRTIMSKGRKNNRTYIDIVEHEKVDPDVQVILSTNVIADGVNILNDSDNWETIIVCSDRSPIFNPTDIKQMSNRLRNEYKRLYLFMTEPKAAEKNELFDMEKTFYNRLNIAQKFADEMNEHAHFDENYFIKSKIERIYAIGLNKGKLEVDKQYLRHLTTESKKKWYQFRLDAFIEAVENILHMKQIDTVLLEKEVGDIQQEIDRLMELKQADEKEKAAMIDELFTEKVYAALKYDNKEMKEAFKKAAHPKHYAAAKNIIKYADYETSKTIIKQVERQADIYACTKAISDLYEVTSLLHDNYKHRQTKTKQVLEYLLELTERDYLTTDEYIKELDRIQGITKCSAQHIKKLESKLSFQRKTKKINGEAKKVRKIIGVITAEAIAEKFNLSVETVHKLLAAYIRKHDLPVITAERKEQADNNVFIPLNFPFTFRIDGTEDESFHRLISQPIEIRERIIS